MYPVHELANIVAMASEKEQLALTEDIRENGQTEAAVLWKGKLVDGRCRQLACETLEIDLKIRTLDSSLTEEEVSKIVKSLNTRRNLTMTQKIASAYKQQLSTHETNGSVSRQWAISDRSLKNFKYVAKHRPELVDTLFDGRSVVVMDSEKGYEVTTNKVSTLSRVIKKNLEYGKVAEDLSESIEFSAEGVIKTEMGKAWYYSIVTRKNLDVETKMYMVELANYKFREC